MRRRARPQEDEPNQLNLWKALCVHLARSLNTCLFFLVGWLLAWCHRRDLSKCSPSNDDALGSSHVVPHDTRWVNYRSCLRLQFACRSCLPRDIPQLDGFDFHWLLVFGILIISNCWTHEAPPSFLNWAGYSRLILNVYGSIQFSHPVRPVTSIPSSTWSNNPTKGAPLFPRSCRLQSRFKYIKCSIRPDIRQCW